MRPHRRRIFLAGVGSLVALAVWCAPAQAVSFTHFTTGITFEPWGIAGGPDGNVWFTEPDGDRVGRITGDGAVTEFSIGIGAGSSPLGITKGPDGNIWFTEPGTDRIGRITPVGTVVEFSAGITPGSEPTEITEGPDGNLWFTEPGIDKIGRITPAGAVTEFDIGAGASENPQDIVAGPDGNLWFTEPGPDRIGRITPAGVVVEFPADAGSDPWGITSGPEGSLWFTKHRHDDVSRITTAGIVTDIEELEIGSSPTGIAAGRDGNLWFTSPGLNRLGRVTPAGSLFNFSSVNFPEEIAVGPDGNLWVTQPGSKRISRVRFEPPLLFSVRARGITQTAATLEALIDPQSEPTTFSFDIGRTTAYGFQTTVRSAGSDATRNAVDQTVTGLAPGTTYHFRLTATNWSGTATGADHTLTTLPDLDRDRDGSNRPLDCRDDDPRIHPGAVDIPRNGINEDCVGGDAEYPALGSTIKAKFRPAGRGAIRFTSLVIAKARRGSTVRLQCKGRGCRLRKSARRIKVKSSSARLQLRKRVRRVRLHRKTRFTVRVTAPRTIGVMTRYRGTGPAVVERCLPPGRAPRKC